TLGRVLGRDAELAHDDLAGRRRAEPVDADDIVGVTLPTEGDARLYCQRRYVRRKDLRAVLGRLLLEQRPRRHRHDPAIDTVLGALRAGAHAHLDCRARSDENAARGGATLATEGVGAARQPGGCELGRAAEPRDFLASQDQPGRTPAAEVPPPRG